MAFLRIGGVLLVSLVVAASAFFVNEGGLVRFEPGFKYEYQYESNVTLHQVDTFKATAKVFIKNIRETGDCQELLLEVEKFKFQSTNNADTNSHRPDFSKWFSFLMAGDGEVKGVYYPPDEDFQIFTTKKAITGLLAGKYSNKGHGKELSYITSEVGNEGNHSSMYRVIPNNHGKEFQKTRVLYKHPVQHAESNLEKTTFIDESLGTIHTVSVSENVTARHAAKFGFDPYYAMRKVDAVNEFEQIRYPELKASSTGKLRFVSRIMDEMEINRPSDMALQPLRLSAAVHRKPESTNVQQMTEYIRSNLTCMRQESGSGLNDHLECFNNIVKQMKDLPSKELRNISMFYLNQQDRRVRINTIDQNAVLDALGAMGTNDSQNLLARLVLERNPPNEFMIQRVLIHIATMQVTPSENILAFLEEALCDEPKFLSKYSLETYHRTLLAAGSVVNKLSNGGQYYTATMFASKLQELLGIHDAWKYRQRRDIMTEEEQLAYDKHHVIVLEALGNGGHDKSYEYILSHLNDTNSPWIKRAGIHALRKYHHSDAAETLLDLWLNDDNEEVRYEAMLQYHSHPYAEFQPQNVRDNQTLSTDTAFLEDHIKSRRKRGIFSKKWNFDLEAPSINWQKHTGSQDIGASFGVVMINFLKLQIAPLSGSVRVNVHDEAYARVHLGFLGINLDFFLARICFKGETGYDVNILQEYDPRLNPELFELVEKSLKDIIGGIQEGTDLITSIINGMADDLSLKRIVDEFLTAFRDIPKQIQNFRKKAVDLAKQIGKYILEELPPFIQPAKDLVKHATDLMSRVKSDFMDFYNSIVQMVETTIPNAATTIYKSAQGIIKAFPKIFKDPKTAVATIGKGVMRIALTVKQLKNIKKTISNAVDQKVMPYLTNIDAEYEKLSEMVRAAFDAIVNKGVVWVKEVLNSEDPISSATGGKMTTADIRLTLVKNLENIVEELFKPFADLRNTVQHYSDKFSQLFSIVSNIKEAVNKLKFGYKQARAAIETIFGPKCHKEFPRLIRVFDEECAGEGFYPSSLGGGFIEYEHKGIDIIIENGKPVVAPFSGSIIRTRYNEVKLMNMQEMITGTEVFITNIQPRDDISSPSDKYAIEKQVSAGEQIGTARSAACGTSSEHIHFAVKRNGEALDPTRFLQPRQPAVPKWNQICDEYKIVYKFQTVDAGTIVGIEGRKEEDTSRNLPDDGTRPNTIDTNEEPHINSGGTINGMVPRRKKRDIIDTAKNMIDVLVETTEAFLEHLSINRITMGNLVSFIEKIGLEDTKTKLAKTLKAIQRVINNKPCKAPDAMTSDELQMELFTRGINSPGSRKDMITALTSPDKRCPQLTIGIPRSGQLVCTFDPSCLGVQCCVNLRIADLLFQSYKAYVGVDVEKWVLSASIEDWQQEWDLGVKDQVKEDTVITGLRFDLLDMEIICRYKIHISPEQIIVTFGAGLCSSEDLSVCVVNVNVIEDAVFPLPQKMVNGTVVLPPVDWVSYLNKETVKAKLKETGESILMQTTDAVINEFLDNLGVPKEYIKDDPMCPIAANMHEEDLREALRSKDQSTNGTREELEQRLIEADLTCTTIDGRTVKLPEITNEALKKVFYISVSENCFRIDACLELSISELYIQRTFSAFIELDPCNFKLNVGIEKFEKSHILIDYIWGAQKQVKLTESIYIRYTLDKTDDTKEFNLDAELVVEDIGFNSKFIENMKMPIPGCNENFHLPGKGDLLSLAEAIGGNLSKVAFNAFLTHLGIEDELIEKKCPDSQEATENCGVDVRDFINEDLNAVLRCSMLENCWGISCCIEFSFDLPLSSEHIVMSTPVLFRIDPCEYFVEAEVGTWTTKKHFLKYNWGEPRVIPIGKDDSMKLSYIVKKDDEHNEFIIDVQLSICLPIDGDKKFCIPNEGELHLIENKHIPACLDQLADYQGFVDFSLTEWLQEQGKKIGDELELAAKDFLLERLGIKDLLSTYSCDRKRHPFSPIVNGWNIACDESVINLPQLPDYMACHIDETCSHIVCCVDIGAIDISLKFDLNLNLCGNEIVIAFEDMITKFENALSDYDWGTEKDFSLGKVFSFRYRIDKTGRDTFIINAHIKACFERNGNCLIDTKIFDSMEIPRRICTSTDNTCMVMVNDIKHQCAMDADCQGVTCEVESTPDMKTETVSVSARIDSCNSKVIIVLDNEKWEKSLTSAVSERSYTISASDNLQVTCSIDGAATDYHVSLNISFCGRDTVDGNCLVTEVFRNLPFKIKACEQPDIRKKRDYETLYDSLELTDALKEQIKGQASSMDTNQLMQSIIDANKNVRHSNMESFKFDPSEAKTTIMSTLKALGQNNPMSVPFLDEDIENGFTYEVQGAEAIINLLEDVTDVFKDAKKTYIVGKGLTMKGVQQLGAMLANMTIGDLEALLDLSNIDAVDIHEIISDLIELATTLYSETVDAITSGEISNAFKSFEITLKGYYKFKPVSSTFFEYPATFFLGPVVIDFSVGAGCVYGIEAGVGLRVMNMVAEATLLPYAGVHLYGGLGICFGPFCAELHLTGYILNLKIPTTAEVEFSKFPLDVGLRMDLYLVPLRLVLTGKVKIKLRIPFCCSISKTIWRKDIWSYSSPLVDMSPLLHLTTKEKDPDPPVFSPVTDVVAKRGVDLPQHCEVTQVTDLDYTEPAFQIAVAASDSLSLVSFFLDVGTIPGGNDVLLQEKLGGALTKVSKVLKPTGVPLFFTMYAQNSQGSRSSVSCSLPTLDVTLPSGRFEADFETSSNPQTLKASIVVHDDSPIVEAYMGIGFGKGIYGDQIKRFTTANLERRYSTENIGDNADEESIITYFTGMKNGRLIGEVTTTKYGIKTVGECARLCLDSPEYHCLSINYDYGESRTCEIMKSIEGQDYSVSKDGLFSHYERLGTGHAVQFNENGLNLEHGNLYIFNLDITNSLGYRRIISTKGTLTDFIPPEPGTIRNAKQDVLETVPCLDLIPADRPDWKKYCVGVDPSARNHRIIIDGEGSYSVFNGRESMTDIKFTRVNNYLSANWDGFRDNETSIRGYTLAFGRNVCEDLIHPHHDPHIHLPSEEHWDNRGQIYPIPQPYTKLPDGQYFATVRALNKVMYGGPLATSVCHSTPYTIDTSPPHVNEIYGLRYDEDSTHLYGHINISDPHSGIAEYDLCFGKTSHRCDLFPWYKYDYSDTNGNIDHPFRIPDGIPTWVRIKAVNNVYLSTVGVADQAIMVDSTGPFAGALFDGAFIKRDMQFSKDNNKICFNWVDFYDAESGISYYLVGAGSEQGTTDLAGPTKISEKEQSICLNIIARGILQHGKTYYGTIWAFNGGVNQKNISSVTDGVVIDLTPPEPGTLVDGTSVNFSDLEFSSSKSSVELQWGGFSDPESGIKKFDVKVMKQGNDGWITLKDWTTVSSSQKIASWNNFHHRHGDFIKSSLRVTNGALNEITVETNGMLIDLTPPVINYLYDGSSESADMEYQSDDTQVSCTFMFYDDESGLSSLKFQVYERYNGQKKKIWPDATEWELFQETASKNFYQKTGLQLMTGAIYTVRVGVSNNAGILAIHETDGVKLDSTKPEIRWLHVGVFYGETEDIHDGYVYQTDHNGIKLSVLIIDPESGVSKILVRVGTSPGTDDIHKDEEYNGIQRDVYLTDLSLEDTDITLQEFAPVYYVTVIAFNGAGQRSKEKISNPIVVLPEDVAGIVYDGISDSDKITDEDYQADSTTISLSFAGFKSTLHGISSFVWAVGSSPGLEDIQSYTEIGVIPPEDQSTLNDGVTGFGYAQMPLYLEHGKTYYATVRGITHGGNVLESSSNGVLVDLTPGKIVFDKIAGFIKNDIDPQQICYLDDFQHLSYEWRYFDDEYKTYGILDNIMATWFSVGLEPFGENVRTLTHQNVNPTYTSHISTDDINIEIYGLPYILNVYIRNKAGLLSVAKTSPVIVDISEPGQEDVTCPNFIPPNGGFECKWAPFIDKESPLVKYLISLGTAEGRSDLMPEVDVPANTTRLEIDASILSLNHKSKLFATVTAINSVKLQTYKFSNSIAVDSTPPVAGVVVELSQDHLFDNNGNIITENIQCENASDCLLLDSVCQESLVSVAIAWQPFEDEESGISGYSIAVGLSKGGTEIQDFQPVRTLTNPLTFKVSGIDLFGVKQVFVMVKATNGAGLSTVSASNGIYISYLSQGLEPFSVIGIWDTDPIIIGDIAFQTDRSTIRAAWDVTGDPCPVVKYEWAIERLDGVLVQDYVSVTGDGIGTNDQQNFHHGEVYYSLLRVTNAFGYQYVLRSDGVTIHDQPLVPGSVYDGDILGFDLSVINSASSITCNWKGFGLPKTETIDNVLSGNLGREKKVEPVEQEVFYYEVGLGSDRRYSHTKDDIAAFKKVNRERTSVTFTNLNLTSVSAVYYCTVKAFSETLSTATVTSNGFLIDFTGGVSANDIVMPRYITSETEMGIQWNDFKSNVGMLLYYVAVADTDRASLDECKRYVDSLQTDNYQETRAMFNVHDLKYVALNTHVTLNNLRLHHGQTYFIYVIGIDLSGDCNMTKAVITVDITPPMRGTITAGPYYNMSLAFTPYHDSISVKWRDFTDEESGIESYELSLWRAASCEKMTPLFQTGETIRVGHNIDAYKLRDLELSRDVPYIVKITITNNARLKIEDKTLPVLFDSSTPYPGKVVEGKDFKNDIVWLGTSDKVQGTILHFPSDSNSVCPTRSISLADDHDWNAYDASRFRQPDGRIWKLTYEPYNVQFQQSLDSLEIKMYRDTKHHQMVSGAVFRSADMEKEGIYEVKIKAAKGNGMAITEIMFLDAPMDSFQTYNYEEEQDLSDDQCSCCLEEPVPSDCPCLNCDGYLASLSTMVTTTLANDEVVRETTASVLTTSKTRGGSVQWQSFQQTQYLIKHNGCGLQIITGEAPYAVIWCRFFNESSPDMVIRSDLQFDPTADFHTYKMVFGVLKEGLSENLDLEVIIDGRKVQKFSGIPQLSKSTQFFMHIWNRDNVIPERFDVFDSWIVKAQFKDLIFPPNTEELCRYGEVFRSGSNPIVRYEAGIGSQTGSTDVYPFQEVLYPCIPCTDNCSTLHCDKDCLVHTEQHTFTLENVHLPTFNKSDNESELITYYLAVKAVLSSGEYVMSYSNGFHVDTTPPVFDAEVFMYIDVDQGEYTPVEYQGCSHTVKSIWLCKDDENEIQNYEWAIGSTVGGTDVQGFLSTGHNPFGINNNLDGILKHGVRYYVSVKCMNMAGLSTLFEDNKGVEVLLEAPAADEVAGEIVGAEPFDTKVDPPDSKKSDDHETVGSSWEVSKDPSVRQYDFCVGSSKKIMDDIFPCLMVGYNQSGEVEVKQGYLLYAGQKMYSLKELGKKTTNSSDPGKFQMETGRVLFPCLRICNRAAKCSKKSLGTVTITSKRSLIKTAVRGSALEFRVKRRLMKRDTYADEIIVESPSDLNTGQTLTVSLLTEEELQQDYGSDATDDFVPYITNPNITAESVERLLSGRIKTFVSSFSVVSVGQLLMTGPLLVSFPQSSEDPSQDNADISMLVHWNPDFQTWQISSRSCIHENDAVIHDAENQTTTVKVCDTRNATSGGYFYAETHFALVLAKPNPVNYAPLLQKIPVLIMQEDEGTLELQLIADDPDGDDIEFYLLSLVEDFPGVAAEMYLDTAGRFTFTPCFTCYGILKDIKILIVDRPQHSELQSANTTDYITIDVQSVNNPPVIFVVNKDGEYILKTDPTEEIYIFIENRLDEHQETVSVFVGAYDLDTTDELTIFEKTNANGTFDVTPVDPLTRDSIFDCNKTMCLNTQPMIDPSRMSWVLSSIRYEQTSSFSGIDKIQIVIQDSEDMYSDLVTISIVVMQMPCLHGGGCMVSGVGTYGCTDIRRISNFFDNYACVCQPGWQGQQCDEDVNECELSPCHSIFKCKNIPGSYECPLADFTIAIIVLTAILVLILFLLCIFRNKISSWIREKMNRPKKLNIFPDNKNKPYISKTSSGSDIFNNKAPAATMSKHDIETLCQKLKNARQTTVSDHPEPIRTTRNISSEDEDSVPPMKSFTGFNRNTAKYPNRKLETEISEDIEIYTCGDGYKVSSLISTEDALRSPRAQEAWVSAKSVCEASSSKPLARVATASDIACELKNNDRSGNGISLLHSRSMSALSTASTVSIPNMVYPEEDDDIFLRLRSTSSRNSFLLDTMFPRTPSPLRDEEIEGLEEVQC